MLYLLALAVLSLFLPVKFDTGIVVLRPFEFLALFALVASLAPRGSRIILIPTGFLLLLPFFGWHVFSAFSGGGINGLRELLQILAVSAFALALAQESGRLNPHKFARILLFGMTIILAYSIGWHLANGYWTGWKRLVEPRLSFAFLPVVLACLILFAKPGNRRTLWLAWAALFPVLVFSGERKALIIQLLLTAALLARGRLAAMIPAAIAVFAGLTILSTLIDDPYMLRQLRGVVDPLSTGQYEYLIATGQYAPGDSPSNVQRAFALKLSSDLLAEHPLLGVGTNQYSNFVNTEFGYLPEVLRLGIHGEFLRVLTENGMIGFGLYLLVWIAAWVRFRRVLRWALHSRLIQPLHARLLPIVLFVPAALFVGTEAAGTRSFVTLILISLLPELAKHGIRMTARQEQSRQQVRMGVGQTVAARPIAGNPR